VNATVIAQRAETFDSFDVAAVYDNPSLLGSRVTMRGRSA
jgi:hypothetical protein